MPGPFATRAFAPSKKLVFAGRGTGLAFAAGAGAAEAPAATFHSKFVGVETKVRTLDQSGWTTLPSPTVLDPAASTEPAGFLRKGVSAAFFWNGLAASFWRPATYVLSASASCSSSISTFSPATSNSVTTPSATDTNFALIVNLPLASFQVRSSSTEYPGAASPSDADATAKTRSRERTWNTRSNRRGDSMMIVTLGMEVDPRIMPASAVTREGSGEDAQEHCGRVSGFRHGTDRPGFVSQDGIWLRFVIFAMFGPSGIVRGSGVGSP